MHISEDVARLVLEHTNVDDSVALSQTCRSFRAVFFELDRLMTDKVVQCCPWMTLEDEGGDRGYESEGRSWRQRALVCAARNRAANNDKNWVRVTSEQALNKSNYSIEEPVEGKTVANPTREELKGYRGTFGDVRLPFKHRRAIAKDGVVYLRERTYPENCLDFCPVSLDLRELTVINQGVGGSADGSGRSADAVSPLREARPVCQLLDFGSESRDSFISPVSGIEVVSATPTDTGNRYPEGLVFYENIMFIDENETVMIVAKRCIASTRHEAFYVYKPDANILDNKLQFNFNHWKQTAMDPLMPPQLIPNSSYVAVVRKIGDSNWACIEHASKKDKDLIQLMKMDTRLFSVQVFNGLLHVYKGNRLYPIWVNLDEKRKLLFNYLLPEEKGQYTLCEVKPVLKRGWKAPGGWKVSRAVPWFAKGGNGRYITVGDFRKGGGYVVADFQTGESYTTQVPYRNDGKPDFVFPSHSVNDNSISFFSWSQVVGRKIVSELDELNDSVEDGDAIDCKEESVKLAKIYDELISPPAPDSESGWEQ